MLEARVNRKFDYPVMNISLTLVEVELLVREFVWIDVLYEKLVGHHVTPVYQGRLQIATSPEVLTARRTYEMMKFLRWTGRPSSAKPK